MAVTVTSLGPNSSVISYESDDTLEMFYPKLIEAITQYGWSIHDSALENKIVLKAPMIDDENVFKYVMIDCESGKAEYKIYLPTYEMWNNETNIGTNLASFSSKASTNEASSNQYLRFGTNWTGNIYVFASPRYLVIFSQITQIGSNTYYGTNHKDGLFSWSGVFEIAKDNPQEITGVYPRFAFTSASMMLGQFSNFTVASAAAKCYSLPRTIFNETTDVAKLNPNVVMYLGGTTSNILARNASHVIGDSIYSIPENTNPFDINTVFAYTLWAGVAGTSPYPEKYHIRGRFYGIKLLAKNVGTHLSTISIPIDSDGFYESTTSGGTLVDHIILGAHTATNMINGSIRFALPL